MAAGFGSFLINLRPEVPWKSDWRREFERRSAEEKAARSRLVQRRKPAAARSPRVKQAGMPKPRQRPTLETNPACPEGCGGPTRLTGGPCWRCQRKARQAARRRFCARGCGTRLYRKGELCSTCVRLPLYLPAERVRCTAGCGRLLRRDAERDVCRPCWKKSRAQVPAAHPVACSLGCGEQTRSANRICYRCARRPQRRAALAKLGYSAAPQQESEAAA